jgi:hypothetical protein
VGSLLAIALIVIEQILQLKIDQNKSKDEINSLELQHYLIGEVYEIVYWLSQAAFVHKYIVTAFEMPQFFTYYQIKLEGKSGMLAAAQSLDDKEFERKDANHRTLTNKKTSDWKMWLSLTFLYLTYIGLTVSNVVILLIIATSPDFKQSTGDLKLFTLDAVDSVHEVMFSAFFTLLFFCALRRIELLIDVLPDLEKNDVEFRRNKYVWGAIFVNKVVHCAISVGAFIINENLTPGDNTDVNPYITKMTTLIFMVEELVNFLTYAFQIKILYDFSRSKLSKVETEDIVLKEQVNLIVYLQTRRLFRCQIHEDQLKKLLGEKEYSKRKTGFEIEKQQNLFEL